MGKLGMATFAAAFLAFSVVHAAQRINLVCSGTMREWSPNLTEGDVAPTTAVLDLDAGTFSTPIGNFRVTKVDETKVLFDNPSSRLKIFGSLDRLTGVMDVIGAEPEEAAKMAAGQSARSSMSANLECGAPRS
jgi:hypothetical protein